MQPINVKKGKKVNVVSKEYNEWLQPDLLSLGKIQDGLKNKSPAEVCNATGLSRHTVYRVRDGAIDNVNYETVKVLSDYFLSNK
jgi:hypothetical protein|tara:strand:- start:9729 stop:9980 length:252 start_codon:yes stop_codon:yes gene_type:complete